MDIVLGVVCITLFWPIVIPMVFCSIIIKADEFLKKQPLHPNNRPNE